MSGAIIEAGSPDDVLSRFHRELQAAVAARVPLELGPSRAGVSTRRASLSNLTALENLVREHMSGRLSASQGAEDDDRLPQRYCAALRLFEQTESTSLVLDGLSHRIRTRRQLSRILRWTLIYLTIVLIIAAILLSFFATFIAPTIDLFRNDLTLTPQSRTADGFDPLVWLPAAVTVVGLLVYVPIALLAFGGSSRLALWLGGRRVETQRAAALALRTIQSLTSRGISTREAASIGCNLVGNDRGVRQTVDRALQGRERDDLGGNELATAADHLQVAADNRLAKLRVLLPSAILAVAGGTLVVTYCLALFWPLVTLIRYLTFPGG